MKNILSILAVLLLYSCNIINPMEQEPTYLTIESIGLDANSLQGGNTEKISDAWVYVNDQFVGTFQMPTTFPVLEEGEQLVEIFAGIKVNGITSIPDAYSFYERDSITVDFQRGQEIKLTPMVKYRDDAIFTLVEQFDSPDTKLNFDADGILATEVKVITDSRSLDGSSGYILLDTANYFFDIASVTLDEYPVTASPYYVEMDYITDVPMNLGLVAYDLSGNVISSNFNQGVLPNTDWNKIYIDLSGPVEEIKNRPGVAYYRLHFTAAIDLTAVDVLLEAEIFLDNLKIVKFE